MPIVTKGIPLISDCDRMILRCSKHFTDQYNIRITRAALAEFQTGKIQFQAESVGYPLGNSNGCDEIVRTATQLRIIRHIGKTSWRI